MAGLYAAPIVAGKYAEAHTIKAVCVIVTTGLVFTLGTAACEPPPEKAPGASAKRGDRRRQPHYITVSVAAFSPDNKLVLVGYERGPELLVLWDATTGRKVRSLRGHTDWVTGAAFVSGGRRALSGSRDGRLLLHDVATGKLVRGLQAYEGTLTQLAASRDGKLALTAGFDKRRSLAKLWDPDGPTLLRAFGASDFVVWDLCLSPDRRWGLSGCRGPTLPPQFVRLWDLDSGQAVHSLPDTQGWRGAAAFSPDSGLALVSKMEQVEASRNRTRLALWDVESGKVVRLLDDEGDLPAQFTPNGKQVVGLALSGAGKIRFNVWDVASGKVRRSPRFAQPDKPNVCVLSPDGRLALAASGRMTEGQVPPEYTPRPDNLRMAVWDLASGRLVREWKCALADP